MAQREIRSYDYVNHPYDRVREALSADPRAVFSAATSAASSRAQAVATQLSVNVGSLEVGTEIAVTVGAVQESGDTPSGRAARIPVSWEAAERPRLFPLMKAELAVYPLTPTETQLDFHGVYEPPGGWMGGAVDAVVGHRIAEASVKRLIADIARYLRETLSD